MANPLQKYYKKGELIGEGSFAKVHRYKNKRTGQKVAVKTIPKSKLFDDKMNRENGRLLLTEIANLRKIKHDHIINLIEVFEDS